MARPQKEDSDKLSARVTIGLTQADCAAAKTVAAAARRTLSDYIRDAVIDRIGRDLARLRRRAA